MSQIQTISMHFLQHRLDALAVEYIKKGFNGLVEHVPAIVGSSQLFHCEL